MKFLQGLFVAGLVIFFGFIALFGHGLPHGIGLSLSTFWQPQFSEFSSHGDQLDKIAEILRNLEHHDEEIIRQQNQHQEKLDAARAEDLKEARDQLQKEQERKEAQERVKRIAAIVYSAICGIPALVIVWLTFSGSTAIPTETANWAYATLGAIGSFWVGG